MNEQELQQRIQQLEQEVKEVKQNVSSGLHKSAKTTDVDASIHSNSH